MDLSTIESDINELENAREKLYIQFKDLETQLKTKKMIQELLKTVKGNSDLKSKLLTELQKQ